MVFQDWAAAILGCIRCNSRERGEYAVAPFIVGLCVGRGGSYVDGQALSQILAASLSNAVVHLGAVHTKRTVIVEDQAIETEQSTYTDRAGVEGLRVAVGVDHNCIRVGE